MKLRLRWAKVRLFICRDARDLSAFALSGALLPASVALSAGCVSRVRCGRVRKDGRE